MAKVAELRVNGKRYSLEVDGESSLLEVLRDHLDLTGSKYGCGEGQCGACTVLIDGLPRRSCRTLASSVEKKEVTTIEGLAEGARLHPVQQAFLEVGAFQCGYCTPGMILSAAALLRVNPNPSEEDVRTFMDGNICRCGVYPRILEAVQRAALVLRKSAS